MEKGMHLSRKANTDTNWFPKIRNNTILICICIPTHLTILYISQTTPFLLRHQYSLYKAGNRVYEDGVLSRLLFDGRYVSFRDSIPTYHYYIRDYLDKQEEIIVTLPEVIVVAPACPRDKGELLIPTFNTNINYDDYKK